MKKGSLAEYAAAHQPQAPEPISQAGGAIPRTYREQQQARAEAEAIKERILTLIDQGTPPEYILYPAFRAIALLTNDDSWAEEAEAALTRLYDGLDQQSLLVDNAAEAAERLEAQQADYIARLRKQLEGQTRKYRQLGQTLRTALQSLNEIDPPEDPDGDKWGNAPAK